MPYINSLKQSLLFSFLISFFAVTAQANDQAVQDVLNMKEEPDGVVFEIATGREAGLKWALPQVKDYIKQLRKRFPDMHIAVVTHGREQFSLQKDKKKKNAKVHSLTQQLVADGVALHVCGTHAEWRGITEEDFPDYVDVSATGPAQINDYKSLGYILIEVERSRK